MRLLYIVFLFSLAGCTSKKSEEQTTETSEHSTACSSIKEFGDVSICMIQFNEMTECYSNPKVAEHINEFRYEGNEILGIYFNKDTFSKIDSLGQFSYDDYFKVYSVKQLKGVEIGTYELDKMTDMMKGNYMKEKLEDIKTKFENNFESVSIDQPVLIESYKPDERIRSFVFLMKMETKDEKKVLVMTINMLEIKQRLIYYAYYKDYINEKSIEQATVTSDYFGFKFLDENS